MSEAGRQFRGSGSGSISIDVYHVEGEALIEAGDSEIKFMSDGTYRIDRVRNLKIPKARMLLPSHGRKVRAAEIGRQHGLPVRGSPALRTRSRSVREN